MICAGERGDLAKILPTVFTHLISPPNGHQSLPRSLSGRQNWGPLDVFRDVRSHRRSHSDGSTPTRHQATVTGVRCANLVPRILTPHPPLCT